METITASHQNKAQRVEIVFGLVGAIGTDLDTLARALKRALISVAYTSRHVRVSRLISEYFDGIDFKIKDRQTHLMNLGDLLRKLSRNNAAAAQMAVTYISHERRRNTDPQNASASTGRLQEVNACATIIRSLKHPDEVKFLRSVYGPRLVVVAAWAPLVERERDVERRLREEDRNHPAKWYAGRRTHLMNRDQSDAEKSYGQKVRDTFELADAYVTIRPGRAIDEQVNRLVRVLFGDPFVTPTEAEQAMFHAWGARLRSSDPGRQVGAVVLDEYGETITTGTNEVPKAGGGQYWTGDSPDHRDFQHGVDMNAQHKAEIVGQILWDLKKHKWLSRERRKLRVEDLKRYAMRKDGPLARGRIRDLLEFGRVVHAEMAVITAAARRGTPPLKGATMYTTTYPCHECARLIIASGVRRVVYTDPYPKSQVPELYRHEIVNSDTSESAPSLVSFEAFEGVAPRLFHRVFEARNRSRDDAGKYNPWEPANSAPSLVVEAETRPSMRLLEAGAVAEFGKQVKKLEGWRRKRVRFSAQGCRSPEWLTDEIRENRRLIKPLRKEFRPADVIAATE